MIQVAHRQRSRTHKRAAEQLTPECRRHRAYMFPSLELLSSLR